VNAAILLASYLKLSTAEQETFDSLHGSVTSQFKAGRAAQAELDRLVSGEESNVIHMVPNERPRGKKAEVGGPTYVAKSFYAQNPNGSAQDLRDFIAKGRFEVNYGSVYSTFIKLRSKAA
jgi:hypothetical protein